MWDSINGMREYFQNRRIHWSGHLERIKERAWSSKYRTFKVSSSLFRGRPTKICSVAIRKYLKERKVNQDLNGCLRQK